MKSDCEQRPRALSLVGGLVAALIVLGFAASAGLAAFAWQEAQQARQLRGHLDGQLGRIQEEQVAATAQLQAWQSTTAGIEERVAALEAEDPAQQLAALEAAVAASQEGQQADSLQASLPGIQATMDGLQDAVDNLAARIDALEADGVVPEKVRLTVPRQRQSHSLSCEASAASMTAQYHGVDLREQEVLAALPRNENPYLGFRGNVDGPTGGLRDYGVYAGPIRSILQHYGLRARTVNGELDGIKAAIARGNPVIAWVTFDCQPSTPSTVAIDGNLVTLVPYQHVVVVTGYDEEGVWANDPWDGQEDFYPAADLQRALAYFGHMAIEVAAP